MIFKDERQTKQTHKKETAHIKPKTTNYRKFPPHLRCDDASTPIASWKVPRYTSECSSKVCEATSPRRV